MILHIAADSSKHLIYPFIEFVNKHFENHFFILCSKEKNIKRFKNAVTKDIFSQEEFFINEMKKAKKIILHGFWYKKVFEIYKKYPDFFEKTIWRPWGGEYYFKNDKNTKWFIQNIKYITHFMREEYKYIKKRFKTNAKFFEVVDYELFMDIKVKKRGKLIQVGNSADPSNRHIEVFLRLKRYKVKVFSPLVYGDDKYKKRVLLVGKKIFKKDFSALTHSVSLKEYLELLENVEIAIFNHKRQQALGNMIALLYLGKKVYLNRNITSWKFFKRIGVEVFDAKRIDLKPLNKQRAIKNKKVLEKFFKRRVKDLKWFFEEV